MRPSGAVVGSAALLLLAACGSSTAPSDTKDLPAPPSRTPDWHTTWDGGPFVASNPLVNEPPLRACPDQGGEPLCHYHRFVPPADVRHVMVAIRPADGFEDDDYDLWVYDDQNVLVAARAEVDGNESVAFANTGAAWYEVRVQPFAVGPGSGYHGLAQAVDRSFDIEPSCQANVLGGETVPDQAGVAGVTDAGERVELSVLLLLDGTDEGAARDVMARAAAAYAPLKVDLVLQGVERVTLGATDSTALIEEAKALTGGAPPAGVDVVGVFTAKEMQNSAVPGFVVVGQADCIGGIRARYNAFFVARDQRASEGDDIAGFYPGMEATAETVAHEIGHLLGAHHHYGNCVEGNLSNAGPGDVSPCTLMFPSVDAASLQFGELEAAAVRGHAVEYASP